VDNIIIKNNFENSEGCIESPPISSQRVAPFFAFPANLLYQT